MLPVEITPGIFWIGVNDRITNLFEGLWDISREGISYNSYLIRDEKNAVVDLNKAILTGEYITRLQSLIDLKEIDYVVINHMEPDHTGVLQMLLTAAPQVQLVGTKKTQTMLKDFYGITENVLVVKEGDTINLGRHTMRFINTPFLHWPETMMTLEETESILFSCDAFGSYGTLNGTIFDDPSVNLDWYVDQALRYYTNIIAIFSRPVRGALTKLADVPVKIIAPSHGLIWRANPGRMVDLYDRWCKLATEPADPGITLLFATMYGNTEAMMEVVAQGIVDEGVKLKIFNIQKDHVSYILPSLYTTRGVMIGAPTYEGMLFPTMEAVLNMAESKHIFNKKASIFGSYAWAGGADRKFVELAEKLKWELLDSLTFNGTPSHEELLRGRQFGAEFARKIKE
ncbi:MAG: FprA family A-type flavoprotein [Leptolinea sp.]|nr:FprA family A-type flavoprotein [Leptolinea sp.]